MSSAPLDGRYLTLHVALEAFARALSGRAKCKAVRASLVKDRDVWQTWVRDHRAELVKLLADPAQEKVFLNKVASAMNPPSSGTTVEALASLEPPLVVDAGTLEELGKRNIPVHHLRINKPGVDYDVDRDVERVERLRTVFAALLARACGYDGPIACWEYNAGRTGRTSPAWWPSPSLASEEEARVSFVCGNERPRLVPTRPKRFSSHIRTRSSRVR